MDPGNAQRLWTGGWYMWRTTNGAATWARASAILPGTGSVSAVAVSPVNGNRVLAGHERRLHRPHHDGLTSGPATGWPASAGGPATCRGLGFHPIEREHRLRHLLDLRRRSTS